MSNSQRIVAGPIGFTELLTGTPTRQPFEVEADDMWWLGYEAAFPAAWMTGGPADDPKVIA